MPRLLYRLLFPVSVVVVGLNLRPILASVSPLLDVIQRDTGLSDTMASLLTTLPVIMMGISLFTTSWLHRAIGERNGVLVGIGLILLACLARAFTPDVMQLLLTAIAGGIGIAILQALMPVVIRRLSGSRTGSLMGLYSTAIMGGAMLASMLSPWLAQLLSWPAALAFWALPALIALTLWPAANNHNNQVAVISEGKSISTSPRAWALLVFFGLGTGAYTLVLAWLPPFFTQLGWSSQSAGNILGVLTAAEVVAGILVSLTIDYFTDRRPVLLAALLFVTVGMLMLALSPIILAWPAAIIAGLGIGALFPLSLIVAVDHGNNAESTGKIIAFVQGGGYILAAALPLVAGVLRQNLSDLTLAWWLMSALCLILTGMAIRFRPGDRI